MPSGTHGRNPFGSGSLNSSSGSFKTIRTGRTNRRYYNGSRVYVFGRRSYCLREGKRSIVRVFSVLAWVFFFIALFAGLGILGSNNEVSSARQDYNMYQQMIQIAEQSPSTLIVDAIVKDIQLDEDSKKYYIEYEITYQEAYDFFGQTKYRDRTLKGISYPIYTVTEARALLYAKDPSNPSKKAPIKVAVEGTPISQETDSVPVDFKNYSIDNIHEYTSPLKAKKNCTIVTIVAGIVFAVSLVAYIISFRKALTQIDKDVKFEESTTSSKPNTTPTNWKCPYCGIINDINTGKCSGCGASKR